MDRILPNILAVITRHPRVRCTDLRFSKDSISQCIFNAFKLVFWMRYGIRPSARLICGQGQQEFRAYTLEAACLYAEDWARKNIKKFFRSFSFEMVEIPTLAFANDFTAGGIKMPYISFAIALDTTAVTSGVSTTPLTQSFTAASGNPLLTVGLIGSADTDNLTGITANGSSMTKVGSTIFAGRETYLYWIVGISGTFNVVSSRSASGDTYMQMDIVSYTGASQSGQPDASITNTGSTATLTVVANNSWVVGMFQAQGNSILSVTNGTQRASGGAGYGMYDSNGGQAPGSFTFTQVGGTGTLASLAASFSPAGSSTGTVHRLLMMGIGS